MPVRPHSLRGHLFILVLALAVPAIALEAWWGLQAYRDAAARAETEALNAATRVNLSLQQFLETAGDLMTGVATERRQRFDEPGGCENIVATLTEVLPYFVNTVVRAPDGSVMCAHTPAPDLDAAFEDPRWWEDVEPFGRLHVAPPIHDLDHGQWVLPLAVPVVSGSEAGPIALVGLVSLAEFQGLVRGMAVADGHLITVATADLQVITRSADAGAWVGQRLPLPTGGFDRPSERPGMRVAGGPDVNNVQRAWAIAEVPGIGWEIFVGVPEAEINAPARAAAIRRVGATMLILLAGILLATFSYRRIAGSLRQLVDATRDTDRGRDVPLPEGTPTEVSAVVRQFNRTLAERDAAEHAERQALERYASIFNDAVFGIFVATPSGTVLEGNPALAAMVGRADGSSLVGASLARWFREPDDHDILLATCLADGTVEGFVTEWIREDGDVIVVRIDGKRVRADGGAEAVEMIVDDVTEELKRDLALQQTQKMEAIGRLAGGIAHDFNNLLTVIAANAELIDEGLPPDSPVRPDLEQIKGAGDRAAALTRQLLAFSRSDTSDMRDVDVNVVVSELNAMLHRLIGANVGLKTALDPDLPTIHADPSRIEQVVMNLVLNARDALPSGGIIRIATQRAHHPEHRSNGAGPEAVLLTVEDDGIGMDAATRRRIFEPFFTTKEEGRGTGLGLATVYGIVSQAGGHIEVESHVDEGTRFRIWFPTGAAD